MNKKKVGTMNFHGSVDITDPCYDRNVWCRMNDVKIKDGEYDCYIWLDKCRYEYPDGFIDVYDVVSIIGIYRNGIVQCEDMEEIGKIGVDSGLAGFFHNKADFSDEEWREMCSTCERGYAWMLKDGFFSVSGDGDGMYKVYAYKQDGEITALEVHFY